MLLETQDLKTNARFILGEEKRPEVSGVGPCGEKQVKPGISAKRSGQQNKRPFEYSRQT
jgi:hypothetical protein